MSPQTKHFLSEQSLYVSWGILLLAISITYMVAMTMAKIEQLTPIVGEVQKLKQDVSAIQTKLQMYDVTIEK